MDIQEPLVMEELIRAPSMVVKSFTTKAFEQRVKLKAAHDESYCSADQVLQQARVAHVRNMKGLSDMAFLQRQSKATISMVRLQAEDYLSQRPDTLLADPCDQSASDDDDDSKEVDRISSSDDGSGDGSGDEDEDGGDRAARNRARHHRAAAIDTKAIYPTLASSQHSYNDVAASCSRDGSSAHCDSVSPGSALTDLSPRGSLGAFSPQPPPGPPPGEANRRADDLLLKYRQFGRPSLSVEPSVRSGNSFTGGGGGGGIGLMAGGVDYSIRSGRVYTPAAAQGLSRIGEAAAVAAPVAASSLAAAVDGPAWGMSAVGKAPPRRARSSNNGITTIAAPANPSSSGGGGAHELPKRGMSYHSLVRFTALGTASEGSPGSSPGPGPNGLFTRHSMDTSSTPRTYRPWSPSLDSTSPGPENLKSQVSPVVGRGDKSLHGRRPPGGRPSVLLGGGSAALAAQMSSVLTSRASEPSVRMGAAGASVHGRQERMMSPGATASYGSTEGEPPPPSSSASQLPDLLAGSATPAAAALFKAITGAEPVGRGPPEGLAERSVRPTRGSQLQQQLLSAYSPFTADVSGQARSPARSGTSTEAPQNGGQSAAQALKLPTINPSGGSFSGASGTGLAGLPSRRSSLTSGDGTSVHGGKVAALSPTAAAVVKPRAKSQGLDVRQSDDEAGLVSKVRGLFNILKR